MIEEPADADGELHASEPAAVVVDPALLDRVAHGDHQHVGTRVVDPGEHVVVLARGIVTVLVPDDVQPSVHGGEMLGGARATTSALAPTRK